MRQFLVLTFLFSVLSGFAQESVRHQFIEELDGEYTYKGKTYNYKELGGIYETHQESLDIYDSGRKTMMSGKIMAYGGILVLTFGGLEMVTANGNKEKTERGALFVAMGFLIELFALIPKQFGRAKLENARVNFNFELIRRQGYKEVSSLLFGTVNQGVGIVFSF